MAGACGSQARHGRHAPRETRHDPGRVDDRALERPLPAVEYAKTTAARRTLKMPEFLREMLAWHLSRFSSKEWVFTSPGGGFLRYDNFRKRVWVPAVEEAGLAPFKFHELRHTAAAFMIDDGADPLQVKRRMGHADIRTTFETYGHLFPDREEALVAALDRRRAAGVARKWGQNGARAAAGGGASPARRPLT
jgi:integrase